jgi:superfamily II DNA or RNA helicase
MSAGNPHLALATLDSWLPGLDRAEVLGLVGHDAVERAAEARLEIVSRPRPLASQLVQAAVADPAGGPYEASAGLGAGGEVACHCSCPSFAVSPPCAHVAELLLELAGSPSLRDELAREARARRGLPPDAVPPADRGRAIALLREQGIDGEMLGRRRKPRLLEDSFRAWRRRGEIRPIGEARFLIGVEAGDPEAPDPSPSLTVHVQPDGERRPFGPDDLEGRRLPAVEWRLFEFLSRAPDGSRNFVARGQAATAFLERVRHARLDLRRAGDGAVLHMVDLGLRPALRLREPASGEIARHPVVIARNAEAKDEIRRIAAAWRRYRDERPEVGWERFLALVAATPDGLEAGDDADAPAVDSLVLEATWTTTRGKATGTPGLDGSGFPVAFAESVVFAGPRGWVYLVPAATFATIADDVGPIALARLVAQPTVIVPRTDVGELPARLREQFRGEGIVLPARKELGLAPLPVPRIALRLTGSAFAVRATLEAVYGGRTIALSPDSLADPDDVTRHAERERLAIGLVAATALERPRIARRRRGAAAPAATGAIEPWTAIGDAAVAFWTRDLPRLVAACGADDGVDEVVVPPGLRQLTVRGPLRSTLAARSKRNGLIQVALRFASEGSPAAVEEIRRALAAKRRWVRLDDGSVAEISERVASLAGMTEETLHRGSTLDLSPYAIGEIDSWRSLADVADVDARVAAWAEGLRHEPGADPGPIVGLMAELRAYQRAGVAWLQTLADIGVGGILADDMGLGKTVQTLALLSWRQHRDGPAPSLVVAPTSVALNWIRESERFTPGLRALLLHGAGRHERYEAVAESDVVVTTYALLRRDVSRLRDIAFRYVVLDEAQHIKNHAAATTAAAKSLAAGARLALTGTPIENRLLELWSILDFCNPGMLGTWRSFAARYERPVVEAIAGPGADGDGPEAPSELSRAASEVEPDGSRPPTAFDQAAALRARIRPFVLRRTKADVQRDLPPKIESDIEVVLTPVQRRAYAALAAAVRADLEPRLARDGLERNRMLVLTALLRLRQMACDPRLVDPQHRAQDSAKLLALRELTSEVIGSGRRALVFSQFVELLSLVRRDLDALGIGYSYLDGRTRDRQGVIDGFVNGQDPLFLLSLRAGGTGINLAAADVVIHLDPWWNPAVEDQATDRAHRIGQTRTVSVYRIVAAGTIEEAIMRLKRRKRALASAVIGDDPGSRMPLSSAEIEELLRFEG